MHTDIPKIKQEAGKLSPKELDIKSSVIFLLPTTGVELKTLPYGAEIEQRAKRSGYKLDSGSPFTTDLPNKTSTRVALAGIDPKKSTFDLLTLARKLVAAHKAQKPERIAIACYGLEPKEAERATEALMAALLAANFTMPDS